MRTLIFLMIVAGSVLMVYNIYRYGRFVKRSNDLEQQSRQSGLLLVPLLLLVFFLIGYVVVGISGLANLMMAGILLGGSIFVHLLLTVMYSIIGRIRETDEVMAARYEEMEDELKALTQNALTTFRVNLTRDEIESRAGANLYDTDLEVQSYTELLESRTQYVLDESVRSFREQFTRERLLQLYHEGKSEVSDVLLSYRGDGAPTYVKAEARLLNKPVSGDIVAFLVEQPYNEQMVRDALVEKVLTREYDRIAYIFNGTLRFLISNPEHESIFLLPRDETEETYESLYLNYILPALSRRREKQEGQPNPLRLSVIEKALEKDPFYEVDAPFEIGGETRYKHFLFYRINQKARMYLMLLTDSTDLQEEQTQRNKALSDALEKAVRANESRIKFFTNVSHDLRTPLNGALGFNALAREATSSPAVRDYLDKAEASGLKLLDLVEDLLSMSLIESGTLELASAPVDLRRLTEELGRQYAARGREKDLSLQVDIEGFTDPVALCDGERLGRILRRLLENAVAFAPEGETVTLSAAQEGPAENGLIPYVFRVRSGGACIPPEVVERVFEADAWKDASTALSLPGVGVGMTLVKAYIDRMGGTVEATEDAEFIIRLPLEPAHTAQEAAEEAPEQAEGRSLHVLLVDDNEINREIAELMLSGAGYTVDQAVNGQEAVDAVSAAPAGTFDVVLMDVQMPILNGYEATGKIRALPDPEVANIPIIALTANAYQEDANAAFAAGMNGYVTKPIDLDTLSGVIWKVLPRTAAGKGADPA